MEYYEAHTRLGEIHNELRHLPVGSASKAVTLLDEAIICVTEMSAYMQTRYPVDVANLRNAQIARVPDKPEPGDGAA